jgi:hypothetical protein
VIIYAGDEAQKGEAESSMGRMGSGSSSKDRYQRSSEDDGGVELIRRYIAKKLGFHEDKKEVFEEKVKVQ